MRTLRNLRTGVVLARNVRVATTPGARELRLLSRAVLCSDDGIWLQGCSAVNSFGMRAVIDVLFLDAANRIVATHVSMAPNQHDVYCVEARTVVQLGVSPQRDVQRGDLLALE